MNPWDEHHSRQKAFFEANPARIATLLFRNPRYLRTFRSKFEFLSSELRGCRRVLEVGVGHGYLIPFFLERMPPDCEYTGVDIAEAPLQEARERLSPAQRARVNLQVAVAESLPFADGSFDGIFCVDVLHHAASQERMLSEMSRVLRPGGKLLCVEPNPLHPANLPYLRDPIEKGIFDLTEPNARKWAEHAGLEGMSLSNLPIFFPSFPAAFERLYGSAENLLARVPGVNRLSTTRVLRAFRPKASAA